MTLPIFVINRARDDARLAAFRQAAEAAGCDFERIDAIDGHDPEAPLFLYRDYLGESFWGGDEIKPGAFACALSHRAAWKRLLADGADAALICEDDVSLEASAFDLMKAAAARDDWDVIFANERMAEWRAVGSVKSDNRLLPLDRCATRISKAGDPPGAPGADAYLLSRRGAEKLLTALSARKVVAGVDWLMVAASLGPAALPGGEFAFLSSTGWVEESLSAHIWRAPVARRIEAGPSSIAHRVSRPLDALRDAPSIEIGVGERAVAPRDLRPDPVANAFEGGRFSEEPALEMMARWMPRGGVFVDIGAHIGGHALFMLRHGGAGRAIVFEHNRFAIAALEEVMRLNDLTARCDMSHLGLGLAEEVGRREAKGAKRNPYAQRLKRGFDEAVRVRPGDALLREEPVDMIKLDIGGEEREALKGLKKTMKRKSPLLAIDMSRPRTEKCLPILERHDYREIERAEWREGENPRRVSLFRRTPPE